MRRLAVGISLTALVTLVLELVLTRVFDVILMPNMAYMVITCAVFAFGLAGLYTTIWPLRDGGPAGSVLALLAALFAASAVALRPVLNLLPFDWDRLGDSLPAQAAAFFAMYVALVIPFFLAGLVLTTAFSRHAKAIQTLYGWDLAGAAVGCVLLIPFLPAIGPGGILFLVAAVALVASALFSTRRAWARGALVAAVGAAVVPYLVPTHALEFREHVDKRGVEDAQRAGRIEFSRWDPISKIDVIPIHDTVGHDADSVLISNAAWHVAYDGGQQSTNFFRFDGDFARLRSALDRGAPGAALENFWQRGVLASHYLKRDTGAHVLVIGSAGGQETKAALTYGAAKVDAVELVRTVVQLGTGPYSKAIGDIFHDPRVRVHVGEGRSFLRASRERYDIIQIFSNFTTSTIANGSGAMSPAYLETAEAYEEFFRHLTPGGILHINHQAYPRMISTAALAWHRLGRTDFRRHVLVFERSDAIDYLPTVLIKMEPWTEAEVSELQRFFATDPRGEGPHGMVEDPLDSAHSALSNAFYSGVFPASLAARMAWRATPVTDDNPFFYFYRKRLAKLRADSAGFLSPSIAGILNSQLKRGWVPLDLIHLIVVGAAGILFSALSIGLPLLLAPVGRQRWAGRPAAMGYFACLGAGFIMLELVLIQLFMNLIGSPLYTYSTVIFTLLFAAGLGSRLSAALGVDAGRRWNLPFLGVLTAGLLLLLGHEALVHAMLAQPLPLRLLACALAIFPLGLFLGMPFPLGILWVERQPEGAVAWAWALNGVFTALGGVATAVLAMTVGFQVTVALALGIYGLAFGLFAMMRAAQAVPAAGEAPVMPSAAQRAAQLPA